MILAGGTGGHIFPALAVACDLRERGVEVRWMGTKRGMEASLVPRAGFEIDWLSVSGVRGMGWLSRIKSPFMIVWACWQAARILRRRKPNAVLGMGGFVSGPGSITAWLLRIPLIIHEQNRIPGTTNRLLAHLARAVLEAFPGTFAAKVKPRTIGNPLRKEIAALPKSREKGTHEPLRVLVIGGSQGAKVLNEIVPEALAPLSASIEVLHQCGQAMVEKTRMAYLALNMEAKVLPFIDNMAEVYAWADVAVCRSGAMTVSELAAASLPAILIPFPYAIDDHQTHNARFLADADAAVLMPQKDLCARRLTETLRGLIADRGRLAAMSRSARGLARLDAARTLGDVCLREGRL